MACLIVGPWRCGAAAAMAWRCPSEPGIRQPPRMMARVAHVLQRSLQAAHTRADSARRTGLCHTRAVVTACACVQYVYYHNVYGSHRVQPLQHFERGLQVVGPLKGHGQQRPLRGAGRSPRPGLLGRLAVRVVQLHPQAL